METSNEVIQIPVRIKELREDLEISVIDMAHDTDIPYETYLSYEEGKHDIPISVLYKIAARCGVDVTVLLTGDDPRMDTAAVCRNNGGVRIERYPGYEFSSLAYNFKHRNLEPLLVFLDPAQEPAALVCHYGQEFNYVIEGTVQVSVGQRNYLLHKGDSIYFDARLPHGQSAVGGPARFITIIQKSVS
ncbi:MAG: XRE family transcriptional regulator [Spirochaetaceae bacterium]|nr:XRE family transcriptional regulator [Spirochaetaceae bacterium]